jgi:hypothetical protein
MDKKYKTYINEMTNKSDISGFKINRVLYDLQNNSGIKICKETLLKLRGCIRKFPDWPLGARTANGTALCH